METSMIAKIIGGAKYLLFGALGIAGLVLLRRSPVNNPRKELPTPAPNMQQADKNVGELTTKQAETAAQHKQIEDTLKPQVTPPSDSLDAAVERWNSPRS